MRGLVPVCRLLPNSCLAIRGTGTVVPRFQGMPLVRCRLDPRRLCAISPWLALALVIVICVGGAAGQISTPPSPAPPLTPEALFERVSPSIFIVQALGADGQVLDQGSGVAVTAEGIVTNYHVVDRATSIRVRQGPYVWVATIAQVDAEHDLCQLRVPGLGAAPPPMRPSATLRVGEKVYAIGAPHGLEPTLSDGLISNLREFEGGIHPSNHCGDLAWF